MEAAEACWPGAAGSEKRREIFSALAEGMSMHMRNLQHLSFAQLEAFSCRCDLGPAGSRPCSARRQACLKLPQGACRKALVDPAGRRRFRRLPFTRSWANAPPPGTCRRPLSPSSPTPLACRAACRLAEPDCGLLPCPSRLPGAGLLPAAGHAEAWGREVPERGEGRPRATEALRPQGMERRRRASAKSGGECHYRPSRARVFSSSAPA